jgi:hypothetical protein
MLDLTKDYYILTRFGIARGRILEILNSKALFVNAPETQVYPPCKYKLWLYQNGGYGMSTTEWYKEDDIYLTYEDAYRSISPKEIDLSNKINAST